LCDSNAAAFWRGHKNIKLDPDCKDLLSGMLAYRPKNRLTLDECLNHKWVAKRPVLDASQLADVVKKKHQEVRRLRRNDASKQMETSIKYRKKRIISNCLSMENLKEFSFCNGMKLPVVENFVPTLLTFFAQKGSLHEAYDAAVNAFRTALKDNCHTNSNSGNPWNVTTRVKVSNGEFEEEFTVTLYIREIKGSGIVAFMFKRIQGDPMAFGRIWDEVEGCLLKLSGRLFFDDLNKCLDAKVEVKEYN